MSTVSLNWVVLDLFWWASVLEGPTVPSVPVVLSLVCSAYVSAQPGSCRWLGLCSSLSGPLVCKADLWTNYPESCVLSLKLPLTTSGILASHLMCLCLWLPSLYLHSYSSVPERTLCWSPCLPKCKALSSTPLAPGARGSPIGETERGFNCSLYWSTLRPNRLSRGRFALRSWSSQIQWLLFIAYVTVDELLSHPPNHLRHGLSGSWFLLL